MATGLMAGWYPDPDGAATLRWWDGQVWTENRQPCVTIACGRCGAGHRVPANYPGYQVQRLRSDAAFLPLSGRLLRDDQ